MARASMWTAAFSIPMLASSLVALAAATPTVTFPFNSQVPLVARKNQPYNFQLSSSTFQPQQGLSYSLSQQPTWLNIDGTNRTLLGTPGDSDVGSSTFTITAADGTGEAHMQCTLVVAGDPAPQLQGDFSQQLAAENNLTSSLPPTVALTPGTNFDFHFRQDSFIDVVQRQLYYYATMADHTPLPAWLRFDSGSLSFSGTAPQLSAFPQSFQIALIASDYKGFAGASATFTLVIASQHLAIVPNVQTISYTPGAPVNYSLANSLYLDGKQLAVSDLRTAQASLPEWATFDAKSLKISGTATQDVSQNGSVTVVDTQGNTAQVLLRFTPGNASLFAGRIGTITATAGQNLDYQIPTSVLNEEDVTLSLTVPSGAAWLSLDSSARAIRGMVPTDSANSLIQATLVAKAPTVSNAQTQTFEVSITTTTAASSPSNTASAAADSTPTRLWAGSIAAIVLCSIIGTALLLALLVWCCLRRRRRQQQDYDRRTPSPQKRLISGPMLIAKGPDVITVTTQVHSDVEKNGGLNTGEDEDRPPQLPLVIPPLQVRSSRLGARASGQSQVSSIGNGEDAIRRDANIPEWGYESAVLQKPHDSFSVPLEMARASSKRSGSMSPSKRALRRAQEKLRSTASIGLGIDTRGEASGINVRKKSGRVKKKASSAGLSATLERSSCASLSTQATSLLSTKPSDFPRPPTQSTFSHGSQSIPRLSMLADKRRSIRLLRRRSDSIDDSRPIELRRESFIRARASASQQSPLFAHGSRNPLEARGRGSSSDVSSGILNRWRSRRQMQRSTNSYSSLNRSESDCRRLSQRVRSVFAPNFPRVISASEQENEHVVVVEDDQDEEWEDITPAQSRHQSASNMPDFAADMAKPRHERNWVLPGEASPTPPPLSATRRGTAGSKWKQRVTKTDRSSSPLVYTTTDIREEEPAPLVPKKSPKRRYSYVNEPLGLVSKDSMNRPRLGDTKTSRPVSVDKIDHLNSLKAETMNDHAQGGSEMSAEYDEAGLMGPDTTWQSTRDTHKSAMSGKVFL